MVARAEGEKQNVIVIPVPWKEHLQGQAGMVALAEYFTHSKPCSGAVDLCSM